MSPKPYPSDLTDAQGHLLEPLLPPAKPGGRPRTTDLRAVANALFYLNRAGCSWRALPHDFPPWDSVYWYFRNWKKDGTFDRLHDQLRGDLRRAEGHDRQPSALSMIGTMAFKRSRSKSPLPSIALNSLILVTLMALLRTGCDKDDGIRQTACSAMPCPKPLASPAGR